MKNVVVLISGRGSNLRALLDTAHREAWSEAIPARIAGAISSRRDAPGLALARAAGTAAIVVDHALHATRESFESALEQEIDALDADLVVLAGFMRVLTSAFVERHAGRLLNIHPSLLPAFPGLATHRRALESGVKVHGATVHFVTPAVDHGPIVIQGTVPVLSDDTETRLADRVLQVEHSILPRAVRWFLDGALDLRHGIVVQRDGASQWIVSQSPSHRCAA